MQILGIYPFSNQDVRIQPFFRNIENTILAKIDYFLFIEESSSAKTKEIITLETSQVKTPFHILSFNNTSRAQNLNHCIKYAITNHFDYIIIFNEGWEDNINEIINIIQNEEYINYSLVTSCRNPKDISLGTFYNFLSNIITSLKTRTIIKETKGDSINIIKVEDIKTEEISDSDNDLFHFKILFSLIKRNKNILFTDVDNGLNYKSYVKLNTKRFLKLLFILFSSRNHYKKF